MVNQRSRKESSRNSTGNKRRKKRFFKLKWLICLLLLGLVVLGVGYQVFDSKTEPFRKRAEKYDLSMIDDVEIKSLILDRKGRELGRIFVENRDKIGIKEVPQVMIEALVAGEDQRFFEHDGVDRIGVVRAAYLNWRAGRRTQGASTLTQQLARNAFHLKEDAQKRGEGALERKAVEAYLALRIEKVYSKDQILEFYLNRIPFGSGYYGIRSAALGYFGKEPRDLTVSECASLVGCIKNPTRISPLNNIEENMKARNQVLARMVAEGFISSKEGKQLQARPVVINPRPIRRGTSHLYERIANAVRSRLGEEALTEGGFKIYTSIDLDVQRAMEKELLKQLAITETKDGYAHPRYESYRKKDGSPDYLQGAGLMIDHHSGAVIAYVGGRDFSHSQYDVLVSGRKPVGTAFFPILYTTALEQKKSPVARLIDRPMDNRAVMVDGREGILGEWGMETLRPTYEGDISMRHGLQVSKIAASVRLGKELGLPKVRATADKFGLSSPKTELLPRMLVGTDDISLPEMVGAYAVFANGGLKSPPLYFIDRVVGPGGEVRYKAKQNEPSQRVISEQTAYLMHDMLQGALRHGAGQKAMSGLAKDPSLAGKTGTTYDFADNWFMGYNSRVTCGLWMGFFHGSRDPIYPGAFSRDTILPAWIKTMNTAAAKFPGSAIKQPEGIIRVEICGVSGLRGTRYCQQYQRDALTGAESHVTTTTNELLLQGTGPTGYCDVHGVIDPDIEQHQDFGSDDISIAQSHAIPVQPKQPLLLGNDPYGTNQPDFAPRDQQSRQDSSALMNFDQLDEADREASIILVRPDRVEIYEQ